MDKEAKNVLYEGTMASFQTIRGDFQQTPLLSPPHDQSHGLRAPIAHTSAYGHRQQSGRPFASRPYPPPPQHLIAQPQPAPAASHPVSEAHSPRSYRPMSGAQPEHTAHFIPYTAIGKTPAMEVTAHERTRLGYIQHRPPHRRQPAQQAPHDNDVEPYPRRRKGTRAQLVQLSISLNFEHILILNK